MSVPRRLLWDIFCTIVDNYGDIGITWRLARQLVHEHDQSVRLWVDDLASFHAIHPEVDPKAESQTLAGVEIRHWGEPLASVQPGDVVIEALACHLPESFEKAMATRQPTPVWVNLEYLSAEDWVADCHGLPSPHPRLPLTKYFFMPGYLPGTGGVLKEANLAAARDTFQGHPATRSEFWRSLGLPEGSDDECRISLFSYQNSSVASLFATWAAGPAPSRCLVPAGKVLADVAAYFGVTDITVGRTLCRDRLTVHILPMLDQDTYDRLLWACDCNFVRGEDSFVRAQWAQKPLVWQAYRQEDGAHWPKIGAFLAHYCARLEDRTAQALRHLWQLWNEGSDVGPAWRSFWAQRLELTAGAVSWAEELERHGDLAGNLLHFCQKKL